MANNYANYNSNVVESENCPEMHYDLLYKSKNNNK